MVPLAMMDTYLESHYTVSILRCFGVLPFYFIQAENVAQFRTCEKL